MAPIHDITGSSPVEGNCLQCGGKTVNPKFCSRRCSAIFNNTKAPKRKPLTRVCSKCNCEFFYKNNKRSLFCDGCKEPKSKSITLQDLIDKGQRAGIHKSWWFAEVRTYNRIWNKNLQKACRVCGYTNHVELAHIRAISSFPVTATIKEINSPDNVVGLCPNHHWELDHGILKLENYPPRA